MRGRGRSSIVIALVVALSGVMAASPGGGPARAAEPSSETYSEPFVMPTIDAPWSSSINDTPAAATDTIDLQPVIDAANETVAALAPQDWDVDALAATTLDPIAAFELVRDAIGFDAYPGVLRGAQGTLAARAGNAHDRALLLKALLDPQGATSRFAFGRLGPEEAARLVAHGFDAPPRPLPTAGISSVDPAFEEAIDLRARRDFGLLRAALESRMAGLDADGTTAAMADVTAHAWVQLQLPDGTWQDLDPTLPDAQPGQTLTAADVTQDDIPETDRDWVTLRVVAESLMDGELSRATVLEAALDSATAARQQVLIAFEPAVSGGGGLLGGGLGGVLGGEGGTGAYVPLLVIDGAAWQGDTVSISADGGGGGFFGGGSTQDLASISLEVEVGVPGMPPRIARHVIADRVPAALRPAGSVTPEDMLPVQDADGAPAVFAAVVHVMVSTGGTDARTVAERQGYAAQVAGWLANAPDDVGDAGLDVAFAPTAVTDEILVVASEQRIVPALDDDQVRAFIATPRVYLATHRLDAADPSRRVIVTDVAIDGVRTLPRQGAPVDSAAAYQLWYGALQGAVETELALANAVSLDPEDPTIEGVSFHMGDPLTVVASGDGAIPAAADSSLKAILDAGGLAVVPGDPVAATSWWEVTSEAATRSVLSPNLGGNWLSKLNNLYRKVRPVQPMQGTRKGAGDEKTILYTIEETVTPEVSKATGHAIKSSFETAAEAAKRAAAKKFGGG